MTSLEDHLRNAVEKNEISTVSSLIEKGANVNVNHPIATWPLCLAARKGFVEIMTLLLDAGADIDAGMHAHKSACYGAVANRRVDALKLLIDRGATVGGALLKAAARITTDDKMMVLLLDAGAPVSGMTSENLMDLVAGTGSVDILKRLVARNVDFCALKGQFNCTLAHRVIDRANRNVDALLRAIADAGLNVDAADTRGFTPLHSAAQHSSARALVELGADIDRQETLGRTALQMACRPRNASSSHVELLLALGADVHLVNKSGQTASHVAVSENHRANLCACLAAGGELDQPDNDGYTVRACTKFLNITLPTSDEIADARRRIAKTRLDLVRERAFQICMGLQPLNVNALELCEIMMHSFGALGSLIALHQWWAIATTVKHFHDRKAEINSDF